MLIEKMDKIMADSVRYGTQLWDFRISGNLMELKVKPNHSDNPEEYRKAVIRAGQVIQALDHQTSAAGQILQIQSFPSLEESNLVALVRVQRSYDSPEANNNLNENLKETRRPLTNLLKSIASHHGLFFHHQNGRMKEEVELLLKSDSRFKPAGRCYSLCTTTDNPFVWLKVGQWLERVSRLREENRSISPIPVVFDLTRETRTELNGAFNDCSYVQILVQLNQNEVTLSEDAV